MDQYTDPHRSERRGDNTDLHRQENRYTQIALVSGGELNYFLYENGYFEI